MTLLKLGARLWHLSHLNILTPTSALRWTLKFPRGSQPSAPRCTRPPQGNVGHLRGALPEMTLPDTSGGPSDTESPSGWPGLGNAERQTKTRQGVGCLESIPFNLQVVAPEAFNTASSETQEKHTEFLTSPNVWNDLILSLSLGHHKHQAGANIEEGTLKYEKKI